MLHFATLFDINYRSRGMALYESLKRHHHSFTLYIVCVDAALFEHFQQQPLQHTILIPLKDIETRYPELHDLKLTRNATDYLFTLSPFYPSYILQRWPELPFICSLDCDQYFFNDSSFVFRDLERHSVLIMPHRFTRELAHLEQYGIFNVSFQVFKNDTTGNACLKLWREQCLAWCSDTLEEDRFADQKYLDSWKSVFGEAVKPILHIGMGVAPWNIGDKKISYRNGAVYIDGQALCLYHYQGLRFVYNNLVNSGLQKYGVSPPAALTKYVLKDIVHAIARYQHNSKKDTITRNAAAGNKGLMAHISTSGMFYLAGNQLISTDKLYQLKTRKEKTYGLLARLANFHR